MIAAGFVLSLCLNVLIGVAAVTWLVARDLRWSGPAVSGLLALGAVVGTGYGIAVADAAALAEAECDDGRCFALYTLVVKGQIAGSLGVGAVWLAACVRGLLADLRG